MGTRNDSVVVDLDGLAKLWAENKTRVLFELLSNSHDPKGTSQINVLLTKLNPDGQDRLYVIQVEDNNPAGFTDLSHAYTMFAESEKKSDPDASGMFNLGEKLVIAVSEEVTILTTTGGLRFDATGRHRLRQKTASGSVVKATISMTKAEVEEMTSMMGMFIPRPGVVVNFNGNVIPERKPITQFEMKLPVPLADAVAANMRLTDRNCTVSIFETLPGETPMLYGLGVPIVVNDSKWHYHVGQKVPVPFDRDNVRPSYMKYLHVQAVNHMHAYITPEDTGAVFVKVAIEDGEITQAAFHDLRVKKHGEKVVVHDPKFPEATRIAVAGGYVPIYGNSESKGFHANNRRFGDVKTAQQVTPQAVPFSAGGRQLKLLDDKKKTAGMELLGEFANMLFRNIVNPNGLLSITWVNDSGWPFSMTFGKTGSGGHLHVNVGNLGYKWFEPAPADTVEVVDLLIHEFAHYYSCNHLSTDYYEALSGLGAKLFVWAQHNPKELKKFRKE